MPTVEENKEAHKKENMGFFHKVVEFIPLVNNVHHFVEGLSVTTTETKNQQRDTGVRKSKGTASDSYTQDDLMKDLEMTGGAKKKKP